MDIDRLDGPQQRWDPFLKEWVIFAPKRGARPFQGKTFEPEAPKKTWTCPFCPDAPEGAGEWVVKQLPNRYSSLDETAGLFEDVDGSPLFHGATNYGKCEVILYSQDHNASFGTLTHENIVALIDLWKERYIALAAFEGIRYPFIMENRGAEIGNSMSHPHGQIFAFPYLPPKIEREFAAFKDHLAQNGICLLCDIVKHEMEDKRRVVEENGSFLAEIPYYARWPFEIHIFAKSHCPSLQEMDAVQRNDLASIMKRVVQRYDALYLDEDTKGKIFPYVMAMHNAPVNTPDRDLWHFHIELYTPFRGKDRWKFLAGVELGTNTFINDSLPEPNAAILRNLKI